ncbi:MAG: TrpB-like pyridoxal phosphate-dependent enzyme [Thermoplasmataceae archaeon]
MLHSQSAEIIPSRWYNVVPDLPEPLPPPRSGSEEKSSIELLNSIIPAEMLRQEFTFNRYERIPDDIREQYLQVGRPTPLVRAVNLEKFLGFTGKIYYKFEGATVTGSHKINTALPQAFYAAQEGVPEIVTETGAGQWGTATSMAGAINGLRTTVFMVKVSYNQKPGRKTVMGLYDGTVIASPSDKTDFGRRILREKPDHPGSLGIAISEAVEYAISNGYRYMLGSVMNSVLTHQSVIGQETIAQLEMLGETPDALIGCVGGGSNFGGFVFPFIPGNRETEMIASTALEVPKFSKGKYRYDFIDSAGILPMLRMFSLGSDFVPGKIYAGGLRYHGSAPSLSILIRNGRIKTDEVGEEEVITALKLFARTQGVVAAPESGHAIASALRYVRNPDNAGKTVVINVSGHGYLDLGIFGEKK